MRESNTLATTKQAAYQAVDKMSRPDGMTRVTWASVHLVLEVIAQSYPKAFPSQRRISERTGIPQRSVRRYIALAVAAELLVVEADAGAQAKSSNGSKTNRYWVKLAASDEANLDPEEVTNTYGVRSSSSRRTSSSVPRSAPAAQNPSEPQRSTVVAMKDWDDERSRNVGTPAAPSLRSKWPVRPDADALVSSIDSRRRKKRREPKPPPDWVRLGDYFNVLWQQMQMETGRYKDTRGLENYRMVRTYMRKHFEGKSELRDPQDDGRVRYRRIEAAYHSQDRSVGVAVLHRSVGAAAARRHWRSLRRLRGGVMSYLLDRMDCRGLSYKNLTKAMCLKVMLWRDSVTDEVTEQTKWGLWVFGERGAGTSYVGKILAADLRFKRGYVNAERVPAAGLVRDLREVWTAQQHARQNSDDVALYRESVATQDAFDAHFFGYDLLWIDQLHDEVVEGDMWRKHIHPLIEERVTEVQRPTIVCTTLTPDDPVFPKGVIERLFVTAHCTGFRPDEDHYRLPIDWADGDG